MNSADHTIKFLDALSFSAYRHRHQRRKGEEQIPYINHPIAVARVLTECKETATDLLIAALLHDVIEDTVSGDQAVAKLADEILFRYGEKVLMTVMEVSDNKNLPFQERKRLQVQHASKLSIDAKKIRIADKICNVNDMVQSPPTGWSADRKQKYINWAKQVVAKASGVNSCLEDKFKATYEMAEKHLEKLTGFG